MASSMEKKKEDSSSNKTTTQQGSPASVGLNTFANDGSFLELFKKKMEEESKKLQRISENTGPGDGEKEDREGSWVEKTEGKVPATANLIQQGKRKLVTGKMGGASRQLYAKKKKEEKEAAEAAKKAEDEAEGKSSAWKAYMEEVKKYREMTCSDDVDRVRPLVK